MTNMRRMPWLTAVASVVLLAGCATSVPAGPDTAELEAYTERRLEAAWAGVHRAGPQPEVERVRYIANAEYVPVMDRCMSQQGAAPGTTANEVAWYVCQAKYPVTPEEYRVLSAAQIDYLYDYYERWTLPCLALRGHPVDLIGESEFVSRGGLWNPLYSTDAGANVSDEAYSVLERDCGIDVVARFPR